MHQLKILMAFSLILMLPAVPAQAQQDNPVYVDDSPQAWELFQQARDQSRDNAGEAIRLYQELLDEFGLKLIRAVDSSPDLLRSVRSRVLKQLQADAEFFERYRTAQTPRAEEMLQAGELEELALERSLTVPGLEALLRLGQRDLEAGRFRVALYWLGQARAHPDLTARQSAHAAFMAGLAAHHLGDTSAVTAALNDLKSLESEGEAFAQQLQRLAAVEDSPALERGVSTLDLGLATDLDDLVPQAIWSVPMPESLLNRRYANRADDPQTINPVIDARMAGGELNTMVATTAGAALFVNQGHAIVALNRLTGRNLWTHPDAGRLGMQERDGNDPNDLSAISVDDGALVTLTGHASTATRTDGGRVICLDAQTGSPRWKPVSLASTVESATGEELFPHGTPIIADGQVFVMARKVGAQLLTSVYLVAIDLDSGVVRWARYIASSGGLRSAPRSFCSAVYRDGSLYVSTALGAAARIEPATGELHWLRRFSVPINAPIIDQGRRPWEVTAPVVTPRGLVTVQPDQRRIALLDLETGDQLESHSSSTSSDWNSPRYLLADDQFVYSIGSEVRAFRLDDLAKPSWRLPALPRTEGELPVESQPDEPRSGDSPVMPPSLDIRGRVQLTANALVVPTSEGVLVVDHETGMVQHRLPVQPPGNPLAVGSQLILACADRVDSYMSLDRAEGMLRERIAQNPADPDPSLSLLRLGMRVRNLALSLESADLAMKSIDRLAAAEPGNLDAGKARDELFDLLLKLAEAKVASTPEQGEQLFGVINSVAVDSRQRAEYLLAYGDWLADSQLNKAVETWQTMLSDPLLSDSWRIADGVMRPASSWATDHLAALMEERGEVVYAPQSDYAAFRLKQIIGAGDPAAADPIALAALAREFPFADASRQAVVQAAAIHMKAGRTRDALGVLLSAYQAAPNKESAVTLLGAAVSHGVTAGWLAQSKAVLVHVVARWGDLSLAAFDGERSAREWLNEINPAADLKYAAIGTAAGEARRLEGQLVEPHDRQVLMPVDRALLRENDQLQLVKADTLEPVWTSPLLGQLPEVLRFDDAGILLWLHTDPQNPKAVMLNAADGTVRWTTPLLAALLGDPNAVDQRLRGVRDQMPNGDPFDHSEILPLISGNLLVLVQRSGGIAAFDLADGSMPRWTQKQTMEQIHEAAAHDGAIVLAGMVRQVAGGAAGAGEAALSSRLLLLDPATGQPLPGNDEFLQPLGRAGVKWMCLTPLGQLVCGSSDGVDVFNIFTSRRMMSTGEYAALDSQRGWQLADTTVLEDNRTRLRTINTATGKLSEPFEMPLRGEWDPLELRHLFLVGDRIVAHYPQRVVNYDPATGGVIGADMVSDDRDYRWLLTAADRTLAISGRTEQAPMNEAGGGAGGGRRTQYVYRVYALSENGKVLEERLDIEPLPERVQYAQLLNGWLLMSTNSDTLAVPMPTEPH